MGKETCPACSQKAFDGNACDNCGYTAGEANRCPHCKAIARVEGTGKNAVCAMCGGPRVPGGFGGDKAKAALGEQKKFLSSARASSLATMLQGGFATLAALVALLVMPAALPGKLLLFALAAVPLFLALRSRSRATAARAKAAEASERAWQAAAEDAASKTAGGITASDLGKKLGVDESEADKLLTNLAVHDRTRIDVGEDAEVRYSVHPDPDDQEASASEEERLLEEHAKELKR